MGKKVVKKKFKTTRLFTFLFVCLFIVSIFMGFNAFADGNVFKLEEAIISDRSDDVTGDITSIDNGEINSDITFHEVGGNVTYNLKIKNTFDDKIKILSITDNNDSDYLIYEYDKHENEELEANDILDFAVKVIYQNEVTEVNERNKTYNVDFLISYEKNGKVEEDTLVLNPKTWDNIGLSIVLFVISSGGLVICFMIDKKKNTKRIVYVLAIFLLVPVCVNAATITYNVSLKTNFQLHDKVVVTYEVNGEDYTYLNKYNNVLDLEAPEVAGYRFDKWILEDGSDFDTSSVLTEDTKIVAKMTKLEATFVSGYDVNQKFKRLAGNSSAVYSTSDSSITSIKRTYEKPDISSMTSDNIISLYNSMVPIYAWFDNGTIYYYTEDLDPAFGVNCDYMFSYFNNLRDIDLDTIDTKNVTVMGSMFFDCTNLTSLDLSNFDTSNVTNMSSMFRNCYKLENVDISSFNTSKVTSLTYMFGHCMKLKNLDLSHFDTSNVTSISSMLEECINLDTINISNFDLTKIVSRDNMIPYTIKNVIARNTKYNNISKGIYAGKSNMVSIDLTGADVSQVTDLDSMFSNCSSLTSLDLSSFDTSNATIMARIFYYCSSLSTLNLSNFDTSNVTDMSWMFYGCSNLTSINLSSFNTTKVIDMSYMFSSCGKLSSLDLSNFNTSKVTNMSYMFSNIGLTSIDLSSFDTSKVTNMSYMFSSCRKLSSLDITMLNTSKVTNMEYMLANLNMPTIDLSHLDTSKVTNMFRMFTGSQFTTLDVSSFITSNVTNMGGMFSQCDKLTSLDLSNFDTSNVTDMSWMFYKNSDLVSLNLSSFNTLKASNMSEMFSECTSLIELDLSSFDTSNTTKMNEIFNHCTHLKTIYVRPSQLNINNVTDTTYMFYDCYELVGGHGTRYRDRGSNIIYARIDDPDNDNPGYLTDIADKPVNP